MQLNACIRKEHAMVTQKIAHYLLAGERPPLDPTPVYLSRTKAMNTSRIWVYPGFPKTFGLMQ